MGRRQAVRRGSLEPVFEGSNPSAPTNLDTGRYMSHGQLKLFSGSAHPALAKEIVEQLDTTLGMARLHRFPDSEVSFQIDENIRGTDVFIIQPTSTPVDEHLMELCVMIDAFRRSSASRITAVIPYYGYARQDRKDKPRVPISAKLVANLLSAAGTNRVLTMDLHKSQIQGFFDIPVDHLFAAPVIIDYCSRLAFPDFTLYDRQIPLNFQIEPFLGRIRFELGPGNHQLFLKLRNTPIRTIANYLSLLSWVFLIWKFLKLKK